MSLLLLWALCVLDSAFCGFRAAAGRSGLIRKRDYYRRAMLRGVLWGQAAALAVGLWGAVALALADDRAALLQDYALASSRLALVALPYAALVLGALALRALPSVDLRSGLSVVVFGPLTLLRPLVAALGVGLAAASAPRPAVVWPLLLALAAMLALEPLLARRLARE